MIENQKFCMSVDPEGRVSELIMKHDPYKMNWVMDAAYLREAGYQDADKLFGAFELIVDGEKISSKGCVPEVKEEKEKVEITYDFPVVKVLFV